MSKTDFLENSLLGHLTGTSYTAPTMHLAVSTTFPTEAGANITEPSTGAYARVTTSAKWGAASGGSVANNAEIAFPESTAAWAAGADLLAFVLFDASSGGNALRYGWLGRTAASDKYFQPADINITTNQITITGHGYVDAESVVLVAPTGSTLAAGITANTRYYVDAIDANTIALHTNVGLSAIVDITTQGVGSQTIFKVVPRAVNAAGITLRFSVGALVLTED